jgi:hypothetical protein
MPSIVFTSGLSRGAAAAKCLSQEAEEWFLSDEADSLFSFVSICAVLGLDAHIIRRRLEGRSASAADSPLKKRRFVNPQHRQVARAAIDPVMEIQYRNVYGESHPGSWLSFNKIRPPALRSGWRHYTL